MRYDLLYILPLQGEETPSNEVKNKIEALLQEAHATIIRAEDPGKRRLAYPMGRTRFGFYGNVIFEAEASVMPTLNHALVLETGILRFQIVQEEQTIPRKLKKERVRPARSTTGVPVAVPTLINPIAKKSEGEKVNLEELDKKLEELLSEEIP